MRWTGQIFWLLAYVPIPFGITFFPPSPPNSRGLAHWEVVSSYSSATAPDSHGISCADPLFQARKELPPEVAACAQRFKIYLIDCVLGWFFSQSARHPRGLVSSPPYHAPAPEKNFPCASHRACP